MRRLLLALVNGILVAVALFYLCAPAVYAYVSEVYLGYGYAPGSFATTVPARLTAQLFARYNAAGPREAAFRKRLACYLVDGGATVHGDCSHEIPVSGHVAGPPDFKVSPGRYVVTLQFGGSEHCGTGTAQVAVVATGGGDEVLASYRGAAGPGTRLALPVRISALEAALDVVDIRVSASAGCVVLETVDWAEFRAGAFR
jgi:hypothetical protein